MPRPLSIQKVEPIHCLFTVHPTLYCVCVTVEPFHYESYTISQMYENATGELLWNPGAKKGTLCSPIQQVYGPRALKTRNVILHSIGLPHENFKVDLPF